MRTFPSDGRHAPLTFHAEERGQSVILVALMFIILIAGAGLSIDVGRFYAERRFVQSAVDAASLACAMSWARTGSAATAWTAGDAVLQQRNLNHNPLGLTLSYAPRGSEVYENNVVDPVKLQSGILPTSNTKGRGCRVAITAAVPTYLIRLVSPGLDTISMVTRAYARAKGGFLPSVVKRYLNAGDTDDVPGNDGVNEFVDTTAAFGFDSSCHAGSNYAPGCVTATVAQPGREIVLFGASQKADNDSSFRGYIGLDVRDFSNAITPGSSSLIHQSYNGVPPDVTVNTLKDLEAKWIDQGYPGPDICVVSNASFLPCAQIAVINGSSSGLFIPHYNRFFNVGDIAMFQLYDGTVKSVPDFSFVSPTLTVPATGPIAAKTVPFSMSSQFANTASVICAEIVPDNGTLTNGPGDTSGTNPFMTGAISTSNTSATCAGTGVGNFSLNPTPSGVTSYSQTLAGMTANSAQQGIYQVFIRGKATAPYDTRIHSQTAKVAVGTSMNEYEISSSESSKSVSMIGLPATVSWNINVTDGSGSTRWKTSSISPDGPITVSWESCPRSTSGVLTVLTCYIGTLGTKSTTVTANTVVPVTVQTTGAATQTTYEGWIRTMGRDAAGNPVVKLWPVRLDVDQSAGGTTQYVDVLGFAAFQITRMDSNDVYGKAVTAAYLDPNDPALAIGKRMTLVPWEAP